MKNTLKKKAALYLAAALGITGVAVRAEEGASESGILESIMKGLSNFVYKVYEWPDNLTVGEASFKIAESLYTVQDGSGDPVLWSDTELKGDMENFYSSTDWSAFEGMYESVEIASQCEAALSDEVAAYEELLDRAAADNGFSLYKEIFKAIAQARFNEHKDAYAEAKKNGKIHGTGDDEFDLFHIDGSWIDGGDTPVEAAKAPELDDTMSLYEQLMVWGDYTVQQSIDLAAEAFASILYDAVPPSPFSTDDLMGVVQGFEYGGKSEAIKGRFEASEYVLSGYSGFVSFVEYFDAAVYSADAGGEEVDYDKLIEKYAKVIANGKTRGSQEKYGKYKYSDQKFYEKVFENYRCAGGGSMEYGSLPEDMKAILQQCMATWDSRVTEKRRQIIQNAVLLYGVTYSMELRNSPSIDNPKYLDCSSFVGQCYYRASVMGQSTVYWTTDTFASNFMRISASELIPGDIGQKTWNPGGSGGSEHIGIYIGTVGGTKYYIHCTGGYTDGIYHAPGKGIKINNYSGFVYFGRCPAL